MAQKIEIDRRHIQRELMNHITSAGFLLTQLRPGDCNVHADIATGELSPQDIAWNNSGELMRRALTGLTRSQLAKVP